jgi:hypothetical protein
MKKFLKPTLAILMSASVMISCSKNDPEPDRDEEVITTMTLIMVPVGGGPNVTATFRDPDGPGGQAPTLHDEIQLQPNTTYNTTINVLDESITPTKNLTEEIREEGHEHEFFFQPSSGLNLTVNKTDMDRNNRPIGLSSSFVTTGASVGNLRVILKHQPDNLKTNNSTVATGTTDIEVDFVTRIQQ